MGFISSRGKVHIDGHKDLTLHLANQVITDARVIGKLYVPKIIANGKEIAFTVTTGDYVKKGQRIGLAPGFYMPIFAPVSGKIIGEEEAYNSLVGRPIPHLVIENDFKEIWAEPLPIIDIAKASHDEIVNAIKEAGIAGLGGAGFPTYVKYEKASNIDALIINAIECEPYLTTDYHAVDSNVEKLIQGTEILMKAATAKEAVIAIKRGKAELVAKIQKAIGSRPGIRVKELADKYPMGWEKVLVYQILKREYKGLPSEAGAIINNASTAIAVATALLEGRPITERTITISGNGVKPALVTVPLYTKVKPLIEFLGGYRSENVDLLSGGPMVAKPMMNDEFVVEKTCGGITVLNHQDYVATPCLRCGRCALGCPASLLPVEIKDAVDKKNIERIKALKADQCIECGTCSYVCPAKIDVTGAIKKAKLFLKIEQAKSAPVKK